MKIYDLDGNPKFEGETFRSVKDAFDRIEEWLRQQGMSDEEIEIALYEYGVR